MNAQQRQALVTLAELSIAVLPANAPKRDCRVEAAFKVGDEVVGKYKDGRLFSLSHWDENNQLSTVRRHKYGWLIKVHGSLLGNFGIDQEFIQYLKDNHLASIAGRFDL